MAPQKVYIDYRHIVARSVSTIGRGRGYDDSVPGDGTKQPLPGTRLRDPLHGRQACPEFNGLVK